MRASITRLQYDRLGLLPSTPAPDFSREFGVLTAAEPLVITPGSGSSGVIYYTLDGRDPRLPGGAVSSNAIIFGGPITIAERTEIRARCLESGQWSMVHTGSFHPPGDPADLQISEILYAPVDEVMEDPRGLEFIEIHNGGSSTIALDGVCIEGGVTFSFPAGQVLQPGERTVVVNEPAVFNNKYGPVGVAGAFAGNLANEGERITLLHEELGIIQEVVYSPSYPWPYAAGHALVPVNLAKPGRPTQSTAWKAGALPGGSPGQADPELGAWIHHEPLGWIYSETGEVSPGQWFFGMFGFFFLGSQNEDGAWTYILR